MELNEIEPPVARKWYMLDNLSDKELHYIYIALKERLKFVMHVHTAPDPKERWYLTDLIRTIEDKTGWH